MKAAPQYKAGQYLKTILFIFPCYYIVIVDYTALELGELEEWIRQIQINDMIF